MPDSPSSSTVASLAATRPTSLNTRCMAGPLPTMRSPSARAPLAKVRAPLRRPRAMAARSVCASTVGSSGFCT